MEPIKSSKPATLKAVMELLRAPDGCPWDREQTHQSLAGYLREEAAEVLDAIAGHSESDAMSEAHLCEELGDLWLQVAFHACLARERGAFDIHDIEAMVVEKLLRRHPHVFAPVSSADTEKGGLSVVRAENSEQVLANWQAVKSLEKAGRPEPGLLEEMPASLSSLDEAAEIGRRCARAGFDWPYLDGVMDKVREEIGELTAESDPERVEAEFGDVLFSLVQWARYKKIDPDSALRKQMRRFRQRFKYVEARAREAGGWERIDPEQMEAAWRRAKGDGTTVLTYAQTQAQADAWFRLQESLAPKSHDKTTGSGPYTVSDALDDYFSERERQSGERARRDKITANASIIPALGGIEVAKLSQRRIEKWLADLAESPRRLRTKPGAGQAYAPPPVTDDEKRARRDTANRILTILKAALNFVFKRGLVAAADPCWQRVEPFKRTSKARVRFLKKEEQVILVNVCPPDFRTLVMAALLTGCRYGELTRMKCGDYDPGLQNPTIFIADSKSGKPRHVYLSKEGKALFEKLTAKRDPESHIFTRSHNKRRSRKDLGARWGRDDQASFMKAACKAAGFKITFHELRHTYASTLVNSGCPLQVVAHQLGHSNTKMVEKHYGHLAPSYIADAVRAVMPTLGIVE